MERRNFLESSAALVALAWAGCSTDPKSELVELLRYPEGTFFHGKDPTKKFSRVATGMYTPQQGSIDDFGELSWHLSYDIGKNLSDYYAASKADKAQFDRGRKKEREIEYTEEYEAKVMALAAKVYNDLVKSPARVSPEELTIEKAVAENLFFRAENLVYDGKNLRASEGDEALQLLRFARIFADRNGLRNLEYPTERELAKNLIPSLQREINTPIDFENARDIEFNKKIEGAYRVLDDIDDSRESDKFPESKKEIRDQFYTRTERMIDSIKDYANPDIVPMNIARMRLDGAKEMVERNIATGKILESKAAWQDDSKYEALTSKLGLAIEGFEQKRREYHKRLATSG